jgi:hypothetical protein
MPESDSISQSPPTATGAVARRLRNPSSPTRKREEQKEVAAILGIPLKSHDDEGDE